MTVTKIEHGQTYRFINISDNRFLDLYMKNTENGTQMFIYDGNTSNAQRFRAEVKEDVFTLLSLCRRKGEPRRVVQESADGKGLVTYADPTGDANQWWFLEIVDTEHGQVVMIKNKGSGKALAHQGYKNQVKCINADANDCHQLWKIIVAEHDQAGHGD